MRVLLDPPRSHSTLCTRQRPLRRGSAPPARAQRGYVYMQTAQRLSAPAHPGLPEVPRGPNASLRHALSGRGSAHPPTCGHAERSRAPSLSLYAKRARCAQSNPRKTAFGVEAAPLPRVDVSNRPVTPPPRLPIPSSSLTAPTAQLRPLLPDSLGNTDPPRAIRAARSPLRLLRFVRIMKPLRPAVNSAAAKFCDLSAGVAGGMPETALIPID